MKLLLVAAMVGTAFGACITATPAQLAAAFVTGGAAGAGSGTDIIVSGAAGSCLAGYSGIATATCLQNTQDWYVTWAGCTACTAQTGCATSTDNTCSTGTATTTKKQCTGASDGYWLSGTGTARIATACDCGTNGMTCTCYEADGADVVITACDAGFAFTAAVAEIPEVTTTVAGQAFIAADATACPAVAGQALIAAAVIAPLVAAVPASCAATACSGEQTGCVATKTTPNTCSTGGKLECTESATGFVITSGAVTACATANAATYVAYVTGTPTTCAALTCNAGWVLASGACVANSCTAGAVPAGYAAAGIASTTVAAVTRACASSCTAASDTCLAGVAAVTGVAAKLASAATTVALLGAVTCATDFVGTPTATCPVADAAFVYAGCAAAPAAAPASVAQTIVAFVLTVVAMYL